MTEDLSNLNTQEFFAILQLRMMNIFKKANDGDIPYSENLEDIDKIISGFQELRRRVELEHKEQQLTEKGIH